jgi:folate-binding protein YgfZ
MTADLVRQQHSALTQATGFADVSDRSQIEITGKDRVQLLHGLCTNDIKSLKPGDGCEAFLTNVQGKTIGYIDVFCCPHSLVIESAPGFASAIISNLDRFVIREDVQFVDRSKEWRQLLVAGPQSPAMLRQWFDADPPSTTYGHTRVDWQSGQVYVRRVPFTGPNSFFLAADPVIADGLIAELEARGAIRCGSPTVEMVRIESGSPMFGRDISDENLPQEVDRNALAISFKKGCYLGQETVARLDALGHVNRTLCGVAFRSAEVPPVGAEIRAGDKTIGRITSACWSVRLDAPLSLAYIRRGHNSVGSRFETPWGDAEVIQLPLA